MTPTSSRRQWRDTTALSREVATGLNVDLSRSGTTPQYSDQLVVNNYDLGVPNPPPSAGDSLTFSEKLTPAARTSP